MRVHGRSGWAGENTPGRAWSRKTALMFSMKTPCQQPSAALPVPSESQTSSEACRSLPRAIITP